MRLLSPALASLQDKKTPNNPIIASKTAEGKTAKQQNVKRRWASDSERGLRACCVVKSRSRRATILSSALPGTEPGIILAAQNQRLRHLRHSLPETRVVNHRRDRYRALRYVHRRNTNNREQRTVAPMKR